jgi:hypothetical protein
MYFAYFFWRSLIGSKFNIINQGMEVILRIHLYLLQCTEKNEHAEKV